jgi:hypothetical protein
VTTRLETAVSRVPDLAALYRQRWQVETARAHRKTTRRMEVLHGHTVPGVLTAWTVFALVYNRVRLVMCPSAKRQHPGVERISVRDARRWRGTPRTGIP